MVSSGRQAIVCVLLLLSITVSVRAQRAVDKSTTSTVSGKVIVGGKGVSGVVVGLVQVHDNSRRFQTRFKGTTDEEGNYRITLVRPGTYEVVASAPAYVATDGPKSLIVGKNEVIENIDITLLRGGVITGKVTDADGRPVIEEWVYLSQTVPRQGLRYPRSIRTDDRGIYRAFGIPAGSYKVAVGRDAQSFPSISSKVGYQRTYHPSALDPAEATAIEVSEGSEAINVDITLGRPVSRYSARGRVIDADTSRPMPGLKIVAQVFFQNGSASSTAAESNKDGEFHVESLAPGKYAVYVETPTDSQWHSDAVRFEVIDQDIDGLVIKSSLGASASGVVVLEGMDDPKVRANLARGKIVGRIASDFIGRANPSASIQPDGSFRINGLPSGRLSFHIQTADRLRLIRIERDGIPYPTGVEIKEREQVTGLRVVFSHANGTIRGVIKVPEGLVLAPTTRFFVSARRTEDASQVSYGSPVEADARGQFVIEGLIPGPYEIGIGIRGGTRPDPRLRIPRTQTVVTYGGVAEVAIILELKPAPSGP